MTLHYHFTKGTPVFIILKNGRKLTNVLLEKQSKAVILKELGHVSFKSIRHLTIHKPS